MRIRVIDRMRVVGPMRVIDRAADAVMGVLLLAVALFADLVATPEPVAGGWSLVLVLQVAAGLAVVHLVRALGGARLAGLGAALLYAAFGLHHAAPAAAGLPVLLLGVERARLASHPASGPHAASAGPGDAAWLMVAAGTFLQCARGWGEAAAAGLVLAGLWTVLRLTMAPGGWSSGLLWRVASGAVVGALLAAPALLLRAERGHETVLASPLHAAAVAALCAAAALAAAAPGRRARAARGLLVVWVALWAGRLAGVRLAAFLLDIAAPMPDGAFAAGARPSVVLALAVLAALLPFRRPGAPVAAVFPVAPVFPVVPGAPVAAVLAALVLAVIGAAALPVVPLARPAASERVDNGAGPNATALALQPGQTLSGTFPAAPIPAAEGPAGAAHGGENPGGEVTEAGVAIGTYRGQASGTLAITLCSGARCSTGLVDLAHAVDNAVAFAAFHPGLRAAPGVPLSWRVRHVGGTGAVAVWLAAAPGASGLAGPDGAIPDADARVSLAFARDPGAAGVLAALGLPAWTAWLLLAAGLLPVLAHLRSVYRRARRPAP